MQCRGLEMVISVLILSRNGPAQCGSAFQSVEKCDIYSQSNLFRLV